MAVQSDVLAMIQANLKQAIQSKKSQEQVSLLLNAFELTICKERILDREV